VKVPARQYDRLYQRAQQARVSIPEVVRRDLSHARGGSKNRK
jgi:hypothetical protein